MWGSPTGVGYLVGDELVVRPKILRTGVLPVPVVGVLLLVLGELRHRKLPAAMAVVIAVVLIAYPVYYMASIRLVVDQVEVRLHQPLAATRLAARGSIAYVLEGPRNAYLCNASSRIEMVMGTYWSGDQLRRLAAHLDVPYRAED
jgi:hypothetical protein